MVIKGTKQAFLRMLEERGVSNKLGVDRSTVSNWKRALSGEDEKYRPTLDKMEEMLLKYGATVKREKEWSVSMP